MAPIHGACERDDLEEVMILVQEDPGVMDLTNNDNDGEMALHSASCRGHVEVVYYLLDQGAYINARDRFGETCLYLACMEGHLEVVEVLTTRGADPTITDCCEHAWVSPFACKLLPMVIWTS